MKLFKSMHGEPQLPAEQPTEYRRSGGAPCPDFKLPAPKAYDVSLLSPDAPSDMLALTLALAFNDLRDASWVLFQLAKGEPSKIAPSAYVGNWLGMRIWMTRYCLGAIHEALKAIRTHRQLLDSDRDLRGAAGRLNKLGKTHWRYVLDLADGSPDTLDDKRFLERVRNNVAYHYYQPKVLAEAFRARFTKRNPAATVATRHLWATSGPQVKDCRFFFADAAAQMALKTIDDNLGSAQERRMKTNIENMTSGLGAFVQAYLYEKQARSKASQTKTPPRRRRRQR